MRIEVLGPVRFVTAEGDPVEVPERHLRILLASLVVAEGDPVSADTLVERLWESDGSPAGVSPARPKKVLQAKLSRLRSLMDEAAPGARDALTYTPAGYRLDVHAENIDAGRFTAQLNRAMHMGASRRKAELLAELVAMWQGRPYGDVADEVWMAPTMTRLKELRGDALELLVGELVDQGNPQEALRQAHGAVEEYPTRENLANRVMLALYQVGRQGEALELFESLRAQLADELGVDPDPGLRELHARILRQDATLEAAVDTRSPVTDVAGRSNLPVVGELIGRESVIGEVENLLGANRLVTLTGIGGVGKTRVALHIAHRQKPEFERGVWFIDLTQLARSHGDNDRTDATERIASLAVTALKLPERSGPHRAMDRMRDALREQSALLVLDNCEHVIAEAAAFTAELIRDAPAVTVLATSREPLGLTEEQRCDVATLSTEPRTGTTGDGEISDAVEFFIARARASDPGFRVSEGSLDAVTELCRRLDGLPLALELAASRIRGLTVEDLLERLSERLNLLRRPGHAVPRRQQTLRGMIDWSWSLLSPKERSVLRRLAVHPGTVCLDAAESVCADPSDQTDDGRVTPDEVVDILIGLVDRSLVATFPSPDGLRYGLLESIAAYAGEELERAGERDAVAMRHLRYYLDLAYQADEKLRGGQQRRWFARMESEHVQLVHAFDEAVRRDDGATATRLAGATFWYHWISGRHADLFRFLPAAVSLSGPRDDSFHRAEVLSAAIHISPGDDEAERRISRVLARIDDDPVRANAQWFWGASLLVSGFRDAGEFHVDQAISVLLKLGEEWDAAIAACQRDWFVVSQWGDPPYDLPGGYSAEEIIRASGDGYGLSQVHGVEYCTAQLDGDHDRARAAADNALEVCQDLGLRVETNYWLTATAIMALRRGEVVAAEERLGTARTEAEEIAYQEGIHFADLGLAMIARQRGDYARARTLLRRCVDFYATGGASTKDLRDFQVQVELGFLAVQVGDVDLAEDALTVLGPRVEEMSRASLTARLQELSAAVQAVRGQYLDAVELLGSAQDGRNAADLVMSFPERQDVDWIRERLSAHSPAPDTERTASGGGVTRDSK